MDLSEDSFAANSDHESRIAVEEMPQPLNEIVEVEEEDDEVVTVLKTPHANPLAKANVAEQSLESPLAGKSVPRSAPDIDAYGSDKENIPASSFRKGSITPRPSSRRSESYVTAVTDIPSEDLADPQEPGQLPLTEGVDYQSKQQQKEEIIETQVPLATSPKHEMHLPSLPTRAPLNMKKSFGVRKSQRTSIMETLTRRSSAIPSWKTLFGQAKESSDHPTTIVTEPAAKSIIESVASKAPAQTLTSATEAVIDPVVSPAKIIEEAPRKEKDDTITIIDTELHLGEQRLKTKFTTDSQRIHDALNSLRIKSTPGQALRDARDAHEKTIDTETPGPVQAAEGHIIDVDDEEEWIPKKDYSSLTERLVKDQAEVHAEVHAADIGREAIPIESVTAEKTSQKTVIENQSVSAAVLSPAVQVAVAAVPEPSPSTLMFNNAAAQAAKVIRNAMAFITNPAGESPAPKPQPSPSPVEKSNNLYPRLDEDPQEPMTDIQVNENFTVHYDDRTSVDSRRDSTYFTQTEAPSQLSQVEIEHPPQSIQSHPPAEHRQSHTAMPPPRKDQPLAKPKPVVMRVQTASQRSKEQQKKTQTATQGTGIYPTLSQSKSVPDLTSPEKVVREETRMSSVSVQSIGTYVKGTGQIKALNAAKLAKQRVVTF